jgi:hypothetical protein
MKGLAAMEAYGKIYPHILTAAGRDMRQILEIPESPRSDNLLSRLGVVAQPDDVGSKTVPVAHVERARSPGKSSLQAPGDSENAEPLAHTSPQRAVVEE